MDWKSVFDNFGVKKVSSTDKSRSAYVVNSAQRKAIEAAGIRPASTRPGPAFDVSVLFDPGVKTIDSSYYYAERSTKAHRSPEPRMGQGFISSWLQAGDLVFIGNVGAQLFAAKLSNVPKSEGVAASELVNRLNRKNTFDRARSAVGMPKKKVGGFKCQVQRWDGYQHSA